MNEQWIERLKHFEAPPPAALWERVEESLDAAPLAGRLQAFESAPPSGLWDRIESELEVPVVGAATEPEVPVLRRRRSFVPYIAAAAVLGAVLVTTVLLFNRSGNNPVARNNDTIQTPATPPTDIARQDQPAPTGDPESDREDAGTTGDRPSRTTGTGVTSTGKAPAHTAPARSLSASIAATDDRYLVRANENGSKVRLSKKVSPVFDCAEHSTGFSWSLCQVSIGVLQEKLAAAPTAVNTDFGGLIDRLLDLEEKTSR